MSTRIRDTSNAGQILRASKAPRSKHVREYCESHGECMAELERLGKLLQKAPVPSEEFVVTERIAGLMSEISGLLSDCVFNLWKIEEEANKQDQDKRLGESDSDQIDDLPEQDRPQIEFPF